MMRLFRAAEAGSALLMVMVLCTVVGIAGVAIFTALEPMFGFEENRFLKSKMLERIETFKNCISDGTSWAYTVNDPSNPAAIRCLNSAQGCAVSTAKIRLVSGEPEPNGGHYCVPGYDPLQPGMGFSFSGEVCNTFSASGNPLCPYRMEFNWMAYCLGGVAPCARPLEIVVGTVSFSPGSRRLRELKLGDGMVRDGFKGVQSYAVMRGLNSNFTPIVLQETQPPGVAAGHCPAGVVMIRKINTVQADFGFYADVRPDGTFVLASGHYVCRISAPGFLVGGHSIQLRNKTDANRLLIWGGAEYAPDGIGYAQTRSVASGQFRLTTASVLAIEQICTTEAVDPAMRPLTAGVPTAFETTPALTAREVYATLNCNRVGGV